MKKDIKQKTKEGIFWTLIFSMFRYGFHFVGSIILARLLFPEDFGLMGLAMLAIQFARRLANFGFSTVLIQLKIIKSEHYDTVFISNIVMMGFITVLLNLFSSYVAGFFHNEELEPILKVISFLFILEAIFSVPRSILRREMKFKELEIGNTIGNTMATLTPIGFALGGYGVWSLVYGNLIGTLISVIASFYYTRWFPKFRFRLWAFKDVFSFGMWFYVNSIIMYFNNNIDYFFIGKFLNATQLGFYERAFNLMSFFKKSVSKNINSVLLSTYSRIQNDNERILRGVLRNIGYISFVSYPVMICMFFTAPSFITVLYGPKWVDTIYPLQIMCISGLVNAIAMVFNPVLMAKGLVKERASRQFTYFIFLAISVYFGLRWGINGVAWGVVISSFFNLFIIIQLTMKHIPLTYRKFVSFQMPAFVYGTCQIVVLLLFQLFTKHIFQIDSWQMLISISILSVIAYIGIHLIVRMKMADEFLQETLVPFVKKIPVINRVNSLHS